jgi:hypothetical protein
MNPPSPAVERRLTPPRRNRTSEGTFTRSTLLTAPLRESHGPATGGPELVRAGAARKGLHPRQRQQHGPRQLGQKPCRTPAPAQRRPGAQPTNFGRSEQPDRCGSSRVLRGAAGLVAGPVTRRCAAGRSGAAGFAARRGIHRSSRIARITSNLRQRGMN